MVSGETTGADLVIVSGGLVVIDGYVRAEDSLTVTGGTASLASDTDAAILVYPMGLMSLVFPADSSRTRGRPTANS